MKPFVVTKQIDAPLESVFEMITNVAALPEKLPHVLSVEILTDGQMGVGTRFKDTRQMKNKTHVTDLEVTEYIQNERVRMVNDDGHAVWDTTYTFAAQGDQTDLKVVMECRPLKLMAKLMIPLFRGMINKGFQHEFDLIKAHCEK